VLVSQYPLKNTSGQVTLGICAQLDITERTQAEAERERLLAQIQGQARQVQQIVDTVPEGVLLLSTGGQVMLTNPTAVENLAVLANAKVGDILTHLGDCSLEELLASPPRGLWHEVTVDEPAPQHFEVIAKPVETGLTTQGWVLVIRDVTQEREVQQRLHRQEQLAVVGQLAGGIAHDFNNLLTTIMLYAQMPLGKGRQDLSPNTTRALETILTESRRAAELVQQILDFSRRSPIQLHSVDLGPFIKDAVRVLERTIPENIGLQVEVEPEGHIVPDGAEATLLTVNADPTRIQQVLMNLVVNARDAMPEGGELSIGLSRVEVRSDEAPPVAGMDAGDWVCLTISDTGTGISPEAQLHLFEPFFTTKKPGKGTGLGLAQVYGIVTQHGGHIGVETEVGKGTTFRIYLPASEKEEDVADEEVLSIPEGQGETILLVEDNVTLREGGQSLLESLGYQVLTAANGGEALQVFEAEGGVDPEQIPPGSDRRSRKIDLVITDLVMPEMGGRELIRELKKQAPDIKVLATTGYVMQEDLETLEKEGFLDVVHKPFDVDTLAQMIRQILDELPKP
jgi:signal transduction histidine kinase/ActR/RegA family two-component response regulator